MSINVLIAGWFSFDDMGATAGDLLCRDLVAKWLEDSHIPYEIANSDSFPGGVDWKSVEPSSVSHLIFVCGPFGQGWPVTEFLDRFEGKPLVGLNLSLLQELDQWDPFELILERDSKKMSRPDLTFLTPPSRVPIVGVIRSHKQKEYGARAMHEVANRFIDDLCRSREMAVVNIDTRLDVENEGGLRTPAEVETLISCMDAVITTRLHGTVLALKSGVPAIAIDPIAGGAKITRQVNAIDWPVWFSVENLSARPLADALEFCLSAEGRERADLCKLAAEQRLAGYRDEVISALRIAESAKA